MIRGERTPAHRERCPSLLTNLKPHVPAKVNKRRVVTGVSSYTFRLNPSPRIKTPDATGRAEDKHLHHAAIMHPVVIQAALMRDGKLPATGWLKGLLRAPYGTSLGFQEPRGNIFSPKSRRASLQQQEGSGSGGAVTSGPKLVRGRAGNVQTAPCFT